MGCDIHMYTEIKRGGEWESADYFVLSDPLSENPKRTLVELYGYRNYALFAVLADVRNNGYDYIESPKGIPDDATEFVKQEYEDQGLDAHSASWFTLRDLINYHENHAPKYHDYDSYILLPLIERLKARANDLYFIHDFTWNGAHHNEAMAKAKYIRIIFWFDN